MRLRLSQPSLAGVGVGADLGNISTPYCITCLYSFIDNANISGIFIENTVSELESQTQSNALMMICKYASAR